MFASKTKTAVTEPTANRCRRTFQWFCLACVGFVLLIPVLLIMYSPAYTDILLRPDYGRSDTSNVQQLLDAPKEEYLFDSNGARLHGLLFRKPNAKIVVVVHHGNAGSLVHRISLAEELVRAGTSVFLYDYAGYGKSSGSATVDGLLKDGVAASNFAASTLGFQNIVNYGESIGSGVACHVDELKPGAALVLQSGITSIPAVAKDVFPVLAMYPTFIWPRPQLDNVSLLAKSKTPLLVIHGELDSMVLPKNSVAMFASSASPDKQLLILPNCAHNDVGVRDREMLATAVSQFITRLSSRL